ncbi:hypothetical protein BsWGS_10982 [Bradybaena similaris]
MEDTVINILKIFKESLQCDETDARNVREDDINLTQLKLKVKEGTCTWNKTSQPANAGNSGHPRTVNITKSNTAGAEAFGQVHTSKESENFVRVTLEKGIVRGLNRMLKLPLDQRNTELIEAFGSTIEIDPSKPVFETKTNKVKIEAAVEGPLGASGATATIRSNQKEYIGRFKCTVIMKGIGLASGFQENIGDNIQRLKKRLPDTELTALTVQTIKGKKVVEFAMEGELECKWDFHQTVEWK